MTQDDLFGDKGPMVTNVKYAPRAADTSRYSGITCWKACKHCDPELHIQNGKSSALRVYRLCSRIGSKCFPASEVCEWSNLFDDVMVTKPDSPGWDDF